jgi:hypothetical protein
MRTLWRTTAYLFWQHPALWLPVVLADLIAFCLRSFQAWMTQAVIRSLVAGHSVLSDTPEPLHTLPVAWAAAFGATRALVELLNLCLYTAAMISISILVPALIAQTKMPWQQILSALGESRLRILLFSLKILVLIAVAGILDIGLITYLPHLHLMFSPIGISRDENIAMITLFLATIVWLLAPSAVAILRPRESPPVGAIGLRHARIFAAVSILSSVAIYFLSTVLRPSFAPLLTTAFGIQVFWGVASVTSALPYIPLFIALCLIANRDSPLAMPPTVDPAPENLPA